MQRLARETGDESDLAYLMTWLASIEILRGDLEAAVALADEAATHATLAGSEFNRAWALTQRAMALAYRGDADGAWASAGEAGKICARFEARQPDAVGARRRSRMLELSRERRQPPRGSALAPAAEPAPHALGRARPLAIALAPAVEALIGARRARPTPRRCLDRLRDATRRRRDRVWAMRRERWRCRALLLAARGELADAHAATERALGRARAASTAPLERGRTLLVQGPDRAAAQAEARRP